MARNGEDYVQNSIYNPFQTNASLVNGSRSEALYRRVLTEIAVNRFKWVGLPDTVDERFLEMTLHFRGLALFYWNRKVDRFLVARGSGAGTFNLYDNPTRFLVLGGGGGDNAIIDETLDGNECVPIWANYLRMPETDIITTYSARLAAIDRTIEVNTLQARRPFLVTAPEEKRLTVLNTMKQIAEGDAVIYGTDSLNPNELIQVFNTGIDKDLILNNLLAKQKIWNECMTLLGINNANQDKKERLVSSEVDANNGQVVATRQMNMNSRQEAARQINRLYRNADGSDSLHVDVVWNLDPGAIPDMPMMGGLE